MLIGRVVDDAMRRIVRHDIRLFYWWHRRQQLKQLLANVDRRQPSTKTMTDSKDVYESYDDRDQRDYETRSRICVEGNRIRRLTFKDIRDRYLAYICGEVDRLLAVRRPIRVLEAGCGNCINLVSLKERYGEDDVDLCGVDISPRRLVVARQHFQGKLDGVELLARSIAERIDDWPDGHFDLVFSVHCLEQIAYKCEDALREIHRLVNDTIALIEPVFELGNPAQRLYLINADHNRVLLKTIRELGYEITRLEPLEVQSNPLNPSTFVVVRKGSSG